MPSIFPPFAPVPSPHPRLDHEAVVRTLAPLLSHERVHRIEQVLRHRLATVTVVLENLHDPHNGGAALRSCEAMGLTHVHVVEPLEPFRTNHKVTKRAHKWLDVYRHSTIQGCLELLQSWGFCCWAAVPPVPGSRPVTRPQVAVDRPVALIFGNEHAGLSQAAQAHSHGTFQIPMFGFTESLNLSVSVAVSLQQVTARRRLHLGRGSDLPTHARDQLRAAYYWLSARHALPVLMRYLQDPG